LTDRRAIVSTRGPQPTATYPHANVQGGLVWVTAQAGRDPANGELVPGGLEGQLERAISNLEGILADCGSSLDHVIQTMVMVVGDPDELLIDSVFERRFEKLPARTVFGVAFLAAEPGHESVRVQLDCLATSISEGAIPPRPRGGVRGGGPQAP
jgi:2-iminobutanoate/2-iminopropanoate deaminase